MFTTYGNSDFEFDDDDDFGLDIFSENVKQENESVLINKRTENSKPNIDVPNSNKPEPLKRQKESNEQWLNIQNKKSRNESSCLSFSSPKKSFTSSSNSDCNLKRPNSPDEKPSKKKLTHEGLIQRKFPGPAGLLPDKPFTEIEDFSDTNNKSKFEDNEMDQSAIYSQSSGAIFLQSPYQKLVSDFDLDIPKNPLTKYTVEWIKKNAMNRVQSNKKVPFISVILHSIDLTTPDPVMLLRDPTGEIHGLLHREVWAQLGFKLSNGVALALRQVGILITGVIRRHIYLNITTRNIVSIYGLVEDSDKVDVTIVNKVSRADLLTGIVDWNNIYCKTSYKNLNRSFSSPTEDDFDDPEPPPSPPPTKESRKFPKKPRKLADVFKKKSSNIVLDIDKILEEEGLGNDVKIPQKTESRGQKSEDKPDVRATEGTTSGVGSLSADESLILDEVLSGIDFAEFEM